MKLTRQQLQDEQLKKRLQGYVKTLRKALAEAESELARIRQEEANKQSLTNPAMTPQFKKYLTILADCNGLNIKNGKHFAAVKMLYLTQLN